MNRFMEREIFQFDVFKRTDVFMIHDAFFMSLDKAFGLRNSGLCMCLVNYFHIALVYCFMKTL